MKLYRTSKTASKEEDALDEKLITNYVLTTKVPEEATTAPLPGTN